MALHTAGKDSAAPLQPSAATSHFADWLIYAAILLCSLMNALFGVYERIADTVAYLDLSDAVRNHNWHAAINASWFPLYPAALAVGRSFFGFHIQYELLAARLIGAGIGLFFVLSAVALAASARRLMLARGVNPNSLLPARTLYLWVAVLAYFFNALDMAGIRPDALVSALMLLTVAALLLAFANQSLSAYAAIGVFAALAYWTKAFAFPFFALCILLAALPNLRRPKILARLALSVLVFSLIAGPYILHISAEKGRLTIGDSGRLNSAWYVDGADRYNPVADPNIYRQGDANLQFKHPGELLSESPQAVYFGGNHIDGSAPQWDDFSYWSDGLTPRFTLRRSLSALKLNLKILAATVPMRLQVLLLLAVLWAWRFKVRKGSFADPILAMTYLLAIACIGSYVLVHLEQRYIAFAFVLMGTIYAASSLNQKPQYDHRALHATLVLIAALLLLYNFQSSLREWKSARSEGANPLHGVYSMPIVSAADALSSHYPHSSEMACMGDQACWNDPYWARYAGMRLTAYIQTGAGYDQNFTAEQACLNLARNPALLDSLRSHHIRAIVARFDGTQACSAAWQPLGTSGYFFYLPL